MWQDLCFGVRTLAKSRGFAAVAVFALALGIGANATVFSLANAILFKNLPFAGSDSVLYVEGVNVRNPQGPDGISVPDYLDLASQARSFQALGANTRVRSNLSDDTTVPESYSGARVTPNTPAAIGQRPILGRAFEAADSRPGSPPVVILTYALWEKRYGKDPAIVGKSIRLNSVPNTVVGILPKSVTFPPEADFWQPLTITGAENRQDRELSVYGRLAPGFTRESAAAEIAALAQRSAQQYPGINRDVRMTLRNFQEISIPGKVRSVFLVLLGAVGFVLMIACANVANLMLSRAVGRSREISIRAALGAGRWRVIRQLLIESLLLSLAGGGLGLAIAQWGTRAFDAAVVPTGKPAWIDFSMDYRAFAYLAAVSVGTSIVFGLVPALRLSRLDINTTLKDGGSGAGLGVTGKYLAGTLVVVEMTLAVVLLAGAGLMMRTFVWAYSRPLGVNPANLLTMRFDLPDTKYPKPADQLEFQRQLTEKLRAVPGVQVAAVASALPSNGSRSTGFETEAAAAGKREVTHFTLITDQYFEALDVAPLRGRLFTALDHSGGLPVAIINQTLARQAWPGQEAIGKRLRFYNSNLPLPWMTVVGVIADILPGSQRANAHPMLYQPYGQDPLPSRFIGVLARTSVPPASLGQTFRRTVQAIDRDLPVQEVSTMQDLIALERWPLRVFGAMFAIFAGIALLLATVGLYAVVAYGVSRRTHEIGVRVALGASDGTILRMVFSTGMRQAGIGLMLGLAAAFGVTRVLSAILVGVSPTDPLTFGAVSAVLLAGAALGCAVPARRAMRVDPAIALRHQ